MTAVKNADVKNFQPVKPEPDWKWASVGEAGAPWSGGLGGVVRFCHRRIEDDALIGGVGKYIINL